MAEEYILTSHGRITIPSKLRKKFGINTPSKVLIEKQEDGIKIYPLNKTNKKKFHLI